MNKRAGPLANNDCNSNMRVLTFSLYSISFLIILEDIFSQARKELKCF